jgi:hypothetical protein
MAYDSWRLGAITIKNLVFPEWWLLAPLPVAFVLLAIESPSVSTACPGERQPHRSHVGEPNELHPMN